MGMKMGGKAIDAPTSASHYEGTQRIEGDDVTCCDRPHTETTT